MTVNLRAERSQLAKRHEPIHASELRSPELPKERAMAPSDCVPVRTHVDVTAFVPAAPSRVGAEVGLVVGGIDKRTRRTRAAVHELAPLSLEPLGRTTSLPLELTLPENVDWDRFQCAVEDQRASEISPAAELQLFGIIEGIPHLRTRLPDAVPQAFVERGGVRHEIGMRLDGLWIDGRRGLLCLTFRGQVPLAHPAEPGKVLVALAGAERRLNDVQVEELLRSLRGVAGARRFEDRLGSKSEATETSVLQALTDEPTSDGTAFLADAAPAWLRQTQSPSSVAYVPVSPTASPRASTKSKDADATAAFSPAGDAEALPAGEATVHSTGPATIGVMPVVAATRGHAAGASAPLPIPAARPPLVTTAGLGPPPTTASAMASPWGRARRDVEPQPLPERSDNNELRKSAEDGRVGELRTKGPMRDVVELVWFDPEASPLLRQRFPSLANDLEFTARNSEHDFAATDPARARDHHTHFGMLVGLPTLGVTDLKERLRAAIGDGGRFTPPVVALVGELTVAFDPVEHLHATCDAVAPLVGDDRRLAEVLAQAEVLRASPLATASRESLQKTIDGLWKAFREQRRHGTIEQIEELVTRSLLEQRKYERRTLLGGDWIRAHLTTSGSREIATCYLPEPLGLFLPMMTRFKARVLAEAHARIDQYESSRHALRVLTLGRVVEL